MASTLFITIVIIIIAIILPSLKPSPAMWILRPYVITLDLATSDSLSRGLKPSSLPALQGYREDCRKQSL